MPQPPLPHKPPRQSSICKLFPCNNYSKSFDGQHLGGYVECNASRLMYNDGMFRTSLAVILSLVVFCAVIPASAANLPLESAQEAVSNLYTYALKIVGLAVFVMFLIAGLSFIIPPLQQRVGNPWDIIKNAVIGLILLFSAYLILNTINPALVGGGSQGGTVSQGVQSLPVTPQRTPLPPEATIIFPPVAGDTNHNGVYTLNGRLHNDDLRVLTIYVNGASVGTLGAGMALTLSNLPPGNVTYSH
jgi:type IV secretion system pilin